MSSNLNLIKYFEHFSTSLVEMFFAKKCSCVKIVDSLETDLSTRVTDFYCVKLLYLYIHKN